MTTLTELYQEMRIRALKASQNLHHDFTKYLCGSLTFDEFIQICHDREAKFEAEMKGDTKE